MRFSCLSCNFTVSTPVSKPYILLSDSSAVEGASVRMNCSLDDGTDPIQYTWEQESYSGLVTILAEGNSSLLNITSVNRNHTGWIRCLARNEVNQQRSDRLWLDVICEWHLMNSQSLEFFFFSQIILCLVCWLLSGAPYSPLFPELI